MATYILLKDAPMSPTLIHSGLVLLHTVAALAAFHVPFALLFNIVAASVNVWFLTRPTG